MSRQAISQMAGPNPWVVNEVWFLELNTKAKVGVDHRLVPARYGIRRRTYVTVLPVMKSATVERPLLSTSGFSLPRSSWRMTYCKMPPWR